MVIEGEGVFCVCVGDGGEMMVEMVLKSQEKFLLSHTLWDRKSEQPPGATEGGSIKEKLEIFIVMCCQLLDSY